MIRPHVGDVASLEITLLYIFVALRWLCRMMETFCDVLRLFLFSCPTSGDVTSLVINISKCALVFYIVHFCPTLVVWDDGDSLYVL